MGGGGGGVGGAVPGAEDRGARADAAAGGGRHQVRGARAQGGVLPVLGHESIGPHRAVALIFICWPLACIPCCMKSCHETTRCLSSGRPPTSRLCAHSSRHTRRASPRPAWAREGGRYPRFEGSAAAAAGAVRWSLTIPCLAVSS